MSEVPYNTAPPISNTFLSRKKTMIFKKNNNKKTQKSKLTQDEVLNLGLVSHTW